MKTKTTNPPLFFSIIIPAHNEEHYIGETLESIRRLSYPHDRFEIIVVENGSTDRTLECARATLPDQGKVYSSEIANVSHAKNFGMDTVSATSDWIVFLDADSHVAPTFLSELNAFLAQPGAHHFTVGTTTVLPLKDTRASAKLWFAFYNVGHRLTKSSFSIQILKASLRNTVRYEERIHFGEDLNLIRDARNYGSFFYFKTRTVFTSTRRFNAIGWWKLFFIWNYQALILSRTLKRGGEYKVIR